MFIMLLVLTKVLFWPPTLRQKCWITYHYHCNIQYTALKSVKKVRIGKYDKKVQWFFKSVFSFLNSEGPLDKASTGFVLYLCYLYITLFLYFLNAAQRTIKEQDFFWAGRYIFEIYSNHRRTIAIWILYYKFFSILILGIIFDLVAQR